MGYIAHFDENNKIQTVKEHSLSTAKLSSDFAIPVLKNALYNMGLLHDLGKYQKSFQERINGKNIKVEHSICGALESANYFSIFLLLIAQYCISGHHSGIPDGGNEFDTPDMPTLYGRKQHKCEDYSDYLLDFTPNRVDDRQIKLLFNNEICRDKCDIIEEFAFLTRYCFSCLTDADSIDTAKFCKGNDNLELKTDFYNCLDKLNKKLNTFLCITELQKSRSEIQKQVYDKVDINSEIYLMNMPTGSGKTLCSMKFALERAMKSGKQRIIYVIPYNSIIDQTVDVFEKLFGDDAQILRHQSSYSIDETDKNEDYKQIVKSATENWNAQIIITTAVQFFESVYANKRGKLRKLHNMADSILVFDEAHLMPTQYIQPCLRAISYITRLLGSEAIFLTATMPDFNQLIDKYSLPNSKITNLVDNTSYFDKFKKCDFVNLGKISAEELIERSENNPTSLIVVNSRKNAREIYSLAGGNKFHLSTYMSLYDRQNTIKRINDEIIQLERDYPGFLNVPDNRKITVVSTSLIEAGVDLDFFAVFRELTSLDSILQSGGRCNREGKRQNAFTYIFSTDNTAVASEKVNLTKGLIEKYEDISCAECINEYYSRFFDMIDSQITKHSISYDCTGIDTIPFATYAKNFELIDGKTVSIVVHRDETSGKLIDELKYSKRCNHRELQKYTFSVYQNEFEDLLRQNAISDFDTGIWCITNPDYYDENIGVLFDAQDYII